MGDELGGHPSQDNLYNERGRVVYERVATLPDFRRGIKKIVELSDQHTLALMCTEEDPMKCHRHPLLALALVERRRASSPFATQRFSSRRLGTE